MHEPETSKRREPFVIGDLAAEGELESLNLEKVQRSQTCRFCCNIFLKEGTDDDEARRDRRELREFQGEGGVIHDEQGRTDTRRMERDVLSDGDRPR